MSRFSRRPNLLGSRLSIPRNLLLQRGQSVRLRIRQTGMGVREFFALRFSVCFLRLVVHGLEMRAACCGA